MMNRRMFWEATLLKLWVLVVLVGVPFACNDSGKKMSHAQQVETLKEVVQVAKDMGLDVDLHARFGPGYYGFFEGLILDPGLSLQLHARVSPEEVTKMAALLERLEGKLDPPQEPPE